MPKWDNHKWKTIPVKEHKGPSTDWMVEIRTAQVVDLLIGEMDRSEIIALMQQEYKLSTQQIDTYIKKAKDRIKQNNDERIKQKLEEKAHIAENRNKLLWKKTIRKWKLDVALRVNAQYIDMNWLEAPKVVRNLNTDVPLTEEQQQQVNEMLAEKYKLEWRDWPFIK